MDNKQVKIIKQEILHYLCDDFNGNQAIFDKISGWACFSNTDLTMVMDKIVAGLKSAQTKINTE